MKDTLSQQIAAVRLYRTSRKHRAWIAILVAAPALLIASCSSSGSDSGSGKTGRITGQPNSAAANLQSMTFVLPLPIESLTWTPEMVAEAGGYFKKEGLNVSFQTAHGTSPAISLEISGKALLSRTSGIGIMQAIGKAGAPLVAVGSQQKAGTLRIVSTAKDPIRKPADLNGKNIGIPSAGGSSDITIDLLEAAGGVDPKSVTKHVTSITPAAFHLLETGRLDAFEPSADVALAIKNQHDNAVLFDPSTDVPAAQNYFTTAKDLKNAQDRDAIKKYLAAIHAAMKFVIADADNGYKNIIDLISSKYNVDSLKDPKVAKSSLDIYVKAWEGQEGPSGLLKNNLDSWNRLYKLMSKAGAVKKGLDPKGWITNDYVPQ